MTPPTTLEDVLDRTVEYLNTYISFPTEHQPRAIALWACYSHVLPLEPMTFDICPYLLVTSAEKGSGKTTLMDLLECIVNQPRSLAGASIAVLVREVGRATVLMDEIDTVFANDRPSERTEELRMIFNLGFKRGATITRLDVRGGPTGKTIEFPTFGEKAMFGIGRQVPDTIKDRSIPIRLERAKAGTPLEKARSHVIRPDGGLISAAFGARAAGIAKGIERQDASMFPPGLSGRAIDIWEPLVAIATMAGERWAGYVKDAIVVLHDEEESESPNIVLLRDCRTVFDETGAGELTTKALLGEPQGPGSPGSGLVGLDESRWEDMGRGKPLNSRGLGMRLGEFGIKSEPLWNGLTGSASRTTQGYRRDAFEDAWDRYLKPVTTPTPIALGL